MCEMNLERGIDVFFLYYSVPNPLLSSASPPRCVNLRKAFDLLVHYKVSKALISTLEAS